jgi:ribosomal-protein-alanine N-acetyltransferase
MTKPSAFAIRLARAADAGIIARLSRDLIETGLGWTWTPERVLRTLRNPDVCAIVAGTGHGLAGFAIMEFLAEHAHLSLLAVDRRRQRRGVGKALVDWLEESARTAGIGTVYVEARVGNEAARRFYRALGYRDLFFMPGYYRGVEAAVRMRHDLRRPAVAPST